MIARWLRIPANRWLEPLLALAVGASLIGAFVSLWTNGYLPHPFFYEPGDPWMDWFNTAFWAHDGGAYDSWRTIYPPLSFMFVSLFDKDACYAAAEGPWSRNCDWVSAVWIHVFYLINIWLIARSYLKIDRSTALPRSFALAAGLPMLYALERANLVLVTFTCILLAFGPLVRSARLRWIAVGMAINFKVYLIAAIFPQLIRRRWRWFEGALIATVAVYLVSYLYMGQGTPFEIYANIAALTEEYKPVGFLDGWYPSSFAPLLSLLDDPWFPSTAILGSQNVAIIQTVLPLYVRIVQLSIVLACAAAWLRPEAVPMHRLTCLGIAMALISAESGGYTQSLVILFVFMERWRGPGLKWAILAAYILCIPADIVIDRFGTVVRDSFFAGDEPITRSYVLTIGPFLRPILFVSIPFALSCVTIRDVWEDIRLQRWRFRWRFRRDLPLLTGQGGYSPVTSTPDSPDPSPRTRLATPS